MKGDTKVCPELKNDWTTLPLVKDMEQLSSTVRTLFSYHKSDEQQREFYLGLLIRKKVKFVKRQILKLISILKTNQFI
jgi:hypothetical protein